MLVVVLVEEHKQVEVLAEALVVVLPAQTLLSVHSLVRLVSIVPCPVPIPLCWHSRHKTPIDWRPLDLSARSAE